MPLPVSMDAARMTASTRDLVMSPGAISTEAVKSGKRPCTLEMPRCWATAPSVGGGRVPDGGDDDGVRPRSQGCRVPHRPSASASARSTCAPVMSVTVTTACDTAHPSRVRILAVSPISRHSSASAGLRSERAARHGPGFSYSPGWASSMSWSSTPRPLTVSAVATGG
jgi:hypothetical protein